MSASVGVLAFIFWIASLAVNIALQILFLSLTITYFLLAAGLDDHPRVIKVGLLSSLATEGTDGTDVPSMKIGALQMILSVTK